MCEVLRVKKTGPQDDGSGFFLRVHGGQLILIDAVMFVRVSVLVFLAGHLFSFLVDCLLTSSSLESVHDLSADSSTQLEVGRVCLSLPLRLLWRLSSCPSSLVLLQLQLVAGLSHS